MQDDNNVKSDNQQDEIDSLVKLILQLLKHVDSDLPIFKKASILLIKKYSKSIIK